MPVFGLTLAGAVEPYEEPIMFDDAHEYLLVSIALPGRRSARPTIPVHHSRPVQPHAGSTCIHESRESALRPSGARSPVGFIGELEFGQHPHRVQGGSSWSRNFLPRLSPRPFSFAIALLSLRPSSACSPFTKRLTALQEIAYNCKLSAASQTKEVTSMDTPELWQFTSSHFNEKARWRWTSSVCRMFATRCIPGFHRGHRQAG